MPMTIYIGWMPALMSIILILAYANAGKWQLLFAAVFCLILTAGCVVVDMISHVLNQRKGLD